MGIGRQSLYDTFGDKRQLFLEAFAHYNETLGARTAERCIRPKSAVAGLRAMLMEVAHQTPAERAKGCFFVNTVAELADRDPEIGSIVRTVTEAGAAMFTAAVQRAQDSKELPATTDARTAGRYLFSSLSGLRLAGKCGTPPAALRAMVDMTLAGIGAT